MTSSTTDTMKHYKLVQPEHMNFQGSLFGGYLLMWIDEVAYMTATLQFPERRFVTIALDQVVFKKRIDCGEVIVFCVSLEHQGTSSLTYSISVKGTREEREEELFATKITFVCLDENGAKKAITAD